MLIPNVQQTIYHYCKTDSLIKILQSKCLWLNPFDSMNDISECRWYKNILDEVCSDLSKKSTTNKDKLNQLYAQIVLGGDFSKKFIVSFSANGNLLSQWRGYAGDGTGFAIGFSTEKMSIPTQLPYMNANDKISLSLCDVFYDKSKQYTFMKDMIQRYLSDNTEPEPNILIKYSSLLSCYAALFKHPGFIEEQECRIIYTPLLLSDNFNNLSLEHDIRATNNKMILFFKWPFPEICPITEIVFGPKNQTPPDTIRALLRENGYPADKIKLTPSGIPYR